MCISCLLARYDSHVCARAPNQTFKDLVNPAHVEPRVITARADWIKKLK